MVMMMDEMYVAFMYVAVAVAVVVVVVVVVDAGTHMLFL